MGIPCRCTDQSLAANQILLCGGERKEFMCEMGSMNPSWSKFLEVHVCFYSYSFANFICLYYPSHRAAEPFIYIGQPPNSLRSWRYWRHRTSNVLVKRSMKFGTKFQIFLFFSDPLTGSIFQCLWLLIKKRDFRFFLFYWIFPVNLFLFCAGKSIWCSD